MLQTARIGIVTLALSGAAMSLPAHADAIDGDWCSSGSKHLTIKGPQITTPAGATLQGNYRRHQFAYVAPAGDPDAGVQIYLELQSEHEMNFYRTKDNQLGEPELWRRCEVTS